MGHFFASPPQTLSEVYFYHYLYELPCFICKRGGASLYLLGVIAWDCCRRYAGMPASVVLWWEGEGCFSKAGAKDLLFLRRMAAVENYNPFESSRIRQLWFLRCVFVGDPMRCGVLEEERGGTGNGRWTGRSCVLHILIYSCMRVESNNPRLSSLASCMITDKLLCYACYTLHRQRSRS